MKLMSMASSVQVVCSKIPTHFSLCRKVLYNVNGAKRYYSAGYIPASWFSPEGSGGSTQKKSQLLMRSSMMQQKERRSQQYLKGISEEDVITEYEQNTLLHSHPAKSLQYFWALVKKHSNKDIVDYRLVSGLDSVLETDMRTMLLPHQVHDIMFLVAILYPNHRSRDFVARLEEYVSERWENWSLLDKLVCMEAAMYIHSSYNIRFMEEQMEQFYGTLMIEVRAMKEVTLVKLCRVISLLYSTWTPLWYLDKHEVNGRKYTHGLLDEVEARLFKNGKISETLYPQDIGIFLQACRNADKTVSLEILTRIAHHDVLRPRVSDKRGTDKVSRGNDSYCKCVVDVINASRRHQTPTVHLSIMEKIAMNVSEHVRHLEVPDTVHLALAFTRERYYFPKLFQETFDTLSKNCEDGFCKLSVSKTVKLVRAMREMGYVPKMGHQKPLTYLFDSAELEKDIQGTLEVVEGALHLGLQNHCRQHIKPLLNGKVAMDDLRKATDPKIAAQLLVNACALLGLGVAVRSIYGTRLDIIGNLLYKATLFLHSTDCSAKKGRVDKPLFLNLQEGEDILSNGKEQMMSSDEVENLDDLSDKELLPKTVEPLEMDAMVDSSKLDKAETHTAFFDESSEDLLDFSHEIQADDVGLSDSEIIRLKQGTKDIGYHVEDENNEEESISRPDLERLRQTPLLRDSKCRLVHFPYMSMDFVEVYLNRRGQPTKVHFLKSRVNDLGLPRKGSPSKAFTHMALFPVGPEQYFINHSELIGKEKSKVDNLKKLGYKVLLVPTELHDSELNDFLSENFVKDGKILKQEAVSGRKNNQDIFSKTLVDLLKGGEVWVNDDDKKEIGKRKKTASITKQQDGLTEQENKVYNMEEIEIIKMPETPKTPKLFEIRAKKCGYCGGLDHINRLSKGIPVCPKRKADEGYS